MNSIRNKIKRWGRKLLSIFLQRELFILNQDIDWDLIKNNIIESQIGKNVKIYKPSFINKTEIGDYTYISTNANISVTKIGKFCSIGPNLFCGWGIHPTNGISTSPIFYSTRQQNGLSLTNKDKIEERKLITIGNDVFIGANVTILDGITIGDGAIIGAGAVVTKDIPDYAIAVGCPIKIIKYRFDDKQISALKRIQWWNFKEENIQDIERMFWNIDEFIRKYDVI
jgi:acetyltransferase-like isoleucine patch superfamily enzyme